MKGFSKLGKFKFQRSEKLCPNSSIYLVHLISSSQLS
jgi:hypothetical protein